MLDNTPAVHDGRDGLTVLIKAAPSANYEGVVDVLDKASMLPGDVVGMVKKALP